MTFTCLACSTVQPASFAGFTCPVCGGNLDIGYDYASARARFPTDRDDIFRYAAVMPVRDLAMAPAVRVGRTPLYRADRLGARAGLRDLWIKDDGLNPSGSLKDRASAVALAVARERGATVIAGATTGNAGSSIAGLAAGAGMPCVIFVPEKAPPAKIAQLLVFGARVLAVRGTYDAAYDLCAQVCRERGWFNYSTGFNPFTREGEKTCSFEIWEQMGRRAPDWVSVCTGDGNVISGIWKGWRDLLAMGLIDRPPKMLCAQAEGSDAVARAVRKMNGAPADWRSVAIEPVRAATIADSISVDSPRDGLAAVRAVIESGGAAVTVSDDEILAAIPEVARNSGVFVEPAAGCSWAGTKRAAREGIIGPDERVVTLLTGNGLKDVAAARRAAGEPVAIDATAAAANRAIDRF